MDASNGRGPAGDARCCHRHGRTTDDEADLVHDATLARRRLLALGGGLAVASLAGCTGGVTDGAAPDPVAIEEGVQCDNCGMVIAMHPGPGGEIFYREQSPEGQENPARFDSLKSCFFPYRLEHERLDWEITAAYVTDYSSVDYELGEEGGTTYISRHVGADAFSPASEVVYVVGSEVEGAMGPDFMPFSDRDEAESFAGDHGGEIVEYDEIDEGLIGR